MNPFRSIRSFMNRYSLEGLGESPSPVRKSLWKSLWRMPKARRALLFLAFFLFLALTANLIANEKPLMLRSEGELYFPILRSGLVELGLSEWPEELKGRDWQNLEHEWALYPPIPYSPQNMDPRNSGTVGPLDEQEVEGMHERHWMGTDQLGHDISAGVIHWSRSALTVGLLAMSIASLIGVFIGSCAGYFGDQRVKLRLGVLTTSIPFLFLSFFYAFYVRGYMLEEAMKSSFPELVGKFSLSLLIFGTGMLLGGWAGKRLSSLPFFNRRVRIPVDLILMRLVDTLLSIPALFLLLGLLAVLGKPSLLQLSIVIGLLAWCHIARLTRAEFLRIRELPYIESSKAIGLTDLRTILHHALPNALPPIIIAVTYGIAASILTASALSFLGLTPGDMSSWGNMLARARSEATAWWLVLFPGTAIFLLVWNFNVLGEALSECLQGDGGKATEERAAH